MCEICSKLTITTPERPRSGVFIFNFEQVSYIDLILCQVLHIGLLLTLNK